MNAVAHHSGTLFAERWREDYRDRWTFFGTPTPRVISVNSSGAFWNNGDGDHFSGAYSKQHFSTNGGLWMEAMIQTPLTATQWQVATMFIHPAPDPEILRLWDHRTGPIPFRASATCTFSYPSGEGMSSIDKTSPGGFVADALGYPSDSLRSGAWYRVLLQLMPDGRCGTAINGRVVHVSALPDAMPDSVSLIRLTQRCQELEYLAPKC